MDLAQAVGTPEDFPLGGTTYRARPLTFAEWGAIHAFIKRNRPGPVQLATAAIAAARASGEPLDETTRDELLAGAFRAGDSWPPRAGSMQWFDALDQIADAATELVFVILSPMNPELTRPQAAAIAAKASVPEYNDLVRFGLYGERYVPKPEAASPQRPPATRKLRRR